MIYAETPRLILRSLERSDLRRVVELIGEWDVVRWLTSVPYPYTLRDAEDYFEKMTEALKKGKPEYFILQHKSSGQSIGSVGLHPPFEPDHTPGEHVIGYWLGKDYWGRGLMSEALDPVIDHAFARDDVLLLTARADPANEASHKVLRKAGFVCLGISQRRDKSLRGGPDVVRWRLTRADYELLHNIPSLLMGEG